MISLTLMRIMKTLTILIGGFAWHGTAMPDSTQGTPVISAKGLRDQPNPGSWSVSLGGTIAKPHKFNAKAPWTAQLSSTSGQSLGEAKVEVQSHRFDASFRSTAQRTGGDRATDHPETFTATVFVCDEAETWCRRDVVSGKVTWADTHTSKRSSSAREQKNSQAEPKAAAASVECVRIGQTTWDTLPAGVVDRSTWTKWTQQLKQPAIVFWTADWCPPCNELKEQVFADSRFGKLTQGLNRIAIDGDGAFAQSLAEPLGVSGYPTILVILPGGAEAARINESIIFEEFETTLKATLQDPLPLQDRVARARAGAGSSAGSGSGAPLTNDWPVLAQTRWEAGMPELGPQPCGPVQTLLELASKAPSSAGHAKDLLVFAAASLVAKCQDEAILNQLTLAYGAALANSLATTAGVLGAHDHLSYFWNDAKQILARLKSEEAEQIRKAWLDAMPTIINDKSGALSPTARLGAFYPLITNQKDTTGRVAPALRQDLTAAIRTELERTKSKFARRAVVTGAADLFEQAGLYTEAEAVLLAELKKSDPSWHHYLYSSLASLEATRNNGTKATEYSSKAAAAATGRATQLQWAVSDLVRFVKTNKDESGSGSRSRIKATYTILFGLEDPFQGRNWKRVSALESALQKHSRPDVMQPIVREFAGLCRRFGDLEKSRCEQHFAALTSQP